MRRRAFIAALGGAAAWPVAAPAQQPGGVRRIAVLMATHDNDPEERGRVAALQRTLQELGWTEGRNARFDVRWAADDGDRVRAYAAELVSFEPDVIFASNTRMVDALQTVTRTIPIVFVQIPESTVARVVGNLTRPTGNVTGFTNFESSVAGKWVELLKEAAPQVSRLALLLDAANPTSPGYLRAVEAGAVPLGLPVAAMSVREAPDIGRMFAEFAREPNGGLVVAPSSLSTTHRPRIVALAKQHRLLAIYPYRDFVAAGGLLSYGIDRVELYRQAAIYADRILRGAKPADLPVQHPTKFELVINLKTAQEIGLTVPPFLLTRADEVIE
jgi:putative tryptophan/tyrosine transport system substrate-binding protein